MIQNVRKILAPIDFSQPSVAAMKGAWELARETRAEVHLLHVVVPHHFFIPLPGDQSSSSEIAREAAMIEQAEEELARIKRDEMDNSKKVFASAVVGSPLTRICDYCVANDIDLIMMSTHGRTGAEGILVGSVTEKVVSHAPCAVLVLRRG